MNLFYTIIPADILCININAFNLLKFIGHVMLQQFNIQQLYALSTLYLCVLYLSEKVPGSSVDIATDYGLDGPGSNAGGDDIYPPVQTGPGVHPASCKMGTGSFLGVKCGRGVLLTTHPLLVPRS